MYRLRSADDLWGIGWDDYLDRGGICAVEWSENVVEAMEDAITVTIEKTGEDSRRITVEGVDLDAFADL
jgi:tRNA threonylcarbamoyladenosine biosynthesis protein TsaE